MCHVDDDAMFWIEIDYHHDACGFAPNIGNSAPSPQQKRPGKRWSRVSPCGSWWAKMVEKVYGWTTNKKTDEWQATDMGEANKWVLFGFLLFFILLCVIAVVEFVGCDFFFVFYMRVWWKSIFVKWGHCCFGTTYWYRRELEHVYSPKDIVY